MTYEIFKDRPLPDFYLTKEHRQKLSTIMDMEYGDCILIKFNEMSFHNIIDYTKAKNRKVHIEIDVDNRRYIVFCVDPKTMFEYDILNFIKIHSKVSKMDIIKKFSYIKANRIQVILDKLKKEDKIFDNTESTGGRPATIYRYKEPVMPYFKKPEEEEELALPELPPKKETEEVDRLHASYFSK